MLTNIINYIKNLFSFPKFVLEKYSNGTYQVRVLQDIFTNWWLRVDSRTGTIKLDSVFATVFDAKEDALAAIEKYKNRTTVQSSEYVR